MTITEKETYDFTKSICPCDCFDCETMNFKSGELKKITYKIIKFIAWFLFTIPLINIFN